MVGGGGRVFRCGPVWGGGGGRWRMDVREGEGWWE